MQQRTKLADAIKNEVDRRKSEQQAAGKNRSSHARSVATSTSTKKFQTP